MCRELNAIKMNWIVHCVHDCTDAHCGKKVDGLLMPPAESPCSASIARRIAKNSHFHSCACIGVERLSCAAQMQASTNTLLAHFASLFFTLWLLRIVSKGGPGGKTQSVAA